MTSAPTPSQTIGPFFRFGLAWLHGRELVPAESHDAVVVRGQVFDGAGDPLPDAVVEIFQADAGGGYPPRWRGFGRCLTGTDGEYRFVTVKPGRTDEVQAPHVEVSVFARGLLQRCHTRMYFPEESAANASDPLLRTIADPDRAATLVALEEGDELRFDIRLQGERETVFFDW
jgi:protocatechuate 3,4-dioxygenase, alpha subunit